MSTDTDSWFERLWHRPESRDDTETVDCDCSDAADAVLALERTERTRAVLPATVAAVVAIGLTDGLTFNALGR